MVLWFCKMQNLVEEHLYLRMGLSAKVVLDEQRQYTGNTVDLQLINVLLEDGPFRKPGTTSNHGAVLPQDHTGIGGFKSPNPLIPLIPQDGLTMFAISQT
jgi:hypothetical protein